jgi:DNA-binding NarL/FixJ family response regulator
VNPEELSSALVAAKEMACVPVILARGEIRAEAMAGYDAAGWALLPSEATGEEILAAARAAMRGLAVLDPRSIATIRSVVSPDAEDKVLSAREREVLQLIAEGMPNKGIARSLGISPHTAKFHVAGVLQKLGAASRAEAVSTGVRKGLVAL